MSALTLLRAFPGQAEGSREALLSGSSGKTLPPCPRAGASACPEHTPAFGLQTPTLGRRAFITAGLPFPSVMRFHDSYLNWTHVKLLRLKVRANTPGPGPSCGHSALIPAAVRSLSGPRQKSLSCFQRRTKVRVNVETVHTLQSPSASIKGKYCLRFGSRLQENSELLSLCKRNS